MKNNTLIAVTWDEYDFFVHCSPEEYIVIDRQPFRKEPEMISDQAITDAIQSTYLCDHCEDTGIEPHTQHQNITVECTVCGNDEHYGMMNDLDICPVCGINRDTLWQGEWCCSESILDEHFETLPSQMLRPR